MPLTSIFSPYGLLDYSSDTPSGESIYRSLAAGLEPAFDVSEGTPAEAEIYADAMALASARSTIARAAAQHDTRTAVEMLPALERDYDVVPGEQETVAERQRVLTARRAISQGSRESAIESALRALLGSAFIAYRVTRPSEIATWPASPESGPGVFGRDDLPAKVARLTTSITATSSFVFESEFRYVAISTFEAGVAEPFAVGDVVTVEAERVGLTERVVIADVSPDGLIAKADFTKAHAAGATLTTGPVPMWTSNQRHVLVVVSDAAATDTETRRRIHDLLRRAVRGVTTWSIVKASTGATVGPFRIGTSGLGTTPLGALPIP
jgi:hypothetical protein